MGSKAEDDWGGEADGFSAAACGLGAGSAVLPQAASKIRRIVGTAVLHRIKRKNYFTAERIRACLRKQLSGLRTAAFMPFDHFAITALLLIVKDEQDPAVQISQNVVIVM